MTWSAGNTCGRDTVGLFGEIPVYVCVLPLKDEARIQKVTKRMHTLEEVNNNVKLLNEMLVHYSKEDSSEADRELMKVGLSCSFFPGILQSVLSSRRECCRVANRAVKWRAVVRNKSSCWE